MKTNKTLFGGIAGGISFFLLGWLIYGILLADFTLNNYNQCAMKPMDQMIWWAIILSNFANGFLLAFIFNLSNTSGWMNGAKIAGIIGLFIAISMDFSFYSMSTMFLNLNAVLIDIIVFTIMNAIGGGIIAIAMGTKEA